MREILMMRRKLLTGAAIALILMLGTGAVRTACADRVSDFTQLSQTQPECPKDPDDCE
jgi:hypothetical protein